MKTNKIVLIIIVIIVCLGIIFFIYNNTIKQNKVAIIDLYKKLIDVTLLENNIQKTDKYISLDVTNLVNPLNGKLLETEQKNELLEYLKKYSSIVYDKNYDALPDSDGYFIKINLSSKTNNSAVINIIFYNNKYSSIMTEYIVNYDNNIWNYKSTGMKVQS